MVRSVTSNGIERCDTFGGNNRNALRINLETSEMQTESRDKFFRRKFKDHSPWVHSPLFWIVFSFNLSNLFGLCHNNGGVVIVMYVISIIIFGIPILLYESLLGQFLGKRPIEISKRLPLFGRGIAATQLIIILSQSILYTFMTATVMEVIYYTAIDSSPLPWLKHCDRRIESNSSQMITLSLHNEFPLCWVCDRNITANDTNNFENCHASFEMYLLTDIWQLTNYTDNLTDWTMVPFNWKIAIFLTVVTIFVFITSLFNTQRIMRFVMPFIVVYSLIVFIALSIIICIQKEFSWKNVSEFSFDMEKFGDSVLWFYVIAHVFTSLFLGIGFVPFHCHASDFKRKKHYRNNAIAIVANTLTFILMEFIWSVSYSYSVNIFSEHITQLNEYKITVPFQIFISIGQAIAFLSQSYSAISIKCISIAFLMAILLIGIMTLSLLNETMQSCFIHDDQKRSDSVKVKIVTSLILLVFVLITTNRGSNISMILYTFSIAIPTIVCCLLQTMVLSWVYGIKNFQNDIYFMIESKIPILITVLWSFVSPFTLICLFIAVLIQNRFWFDFSYMEITKIAEVTAIILALLPLPIAIIIKLMKAPAYTLRERFSHIMKPSGEWGPKSPYYRGHWISRLSLNRILLERRSSSTSFILPLRNDSYPNNADIRQDYHTQF